MTRRAAKAFQGHLKVAQTRTAASDRTKASPPRQEDEGLGILRIQPQLAHEARSGDGLQGDEAQPLIGLVPQNEGDGARAEVADAVEDHQIVHQR